MHAFSPQFHCKEFSSRHSSCFLNVNSSFSRFSSFLANMTIYSSSDCLFYHIFLDPQFFKETLGISKRKGKLRIKRENLWDERFVNFWVFVWAWKHLYKIEQRWLERVDELIDFKDCWKSLDEIELLKLQ